MNDSEIPGSRESIQETLRQLEVIRRAVGGISEPEFHPTILKVTWQTQIVIQVIGIVLSGGLCLIELFGDQFTLRCLMASVGNPPYRLAGLVEIALSLFLLSAILILLVNRASSGTSADRRQFIARHFSYLSNLSFFSDLILKYTSFCVAIASLHPEWCGPLFTLFIADYLIQGRVFVIELRASLMLGCIALCTSGYMWINHNPSILIPAIFYALASAASLAQLWYIRPSQPVRSTQ